MKYFILVGPVPVPPLQTGIEQKMKQNSRRFERSQWTECLVPALLLVLLLGLVATMLVIALALLGLTPGA